MINLKHNAADRAVAEKVLSALEAKPGFDARKTALLAVATLSAANRKSAAPRGDTVKLADGTVVRVEKNGQFLAVSINGKRVYSVGGREADHA